VPPPVPRYNKDRVILKWTTKDAGFTSAVTSLIHWYSTNDCWSCMACCRCISEDIRFHQQHRILHWTTVPLSLMWRQRASLHDARVPAHLPPSTVSLASCCAAMIYYTHTIDGQSVLAPSQPTYLVVLTTAYMHMYVLFTLSSFGQSSKNRDPWPQPRYNRIRSILKHAITRVQCTAMWSIIIAEWEEHSASTDLPVYDVQSTAMDTSSISSWMPPSLMKLDTGLQLCRCGRHSSNSSTFSWITSGENLAAWNVYSTHTHRWVATLKHRQPQHKSVLYLVIPALIKDSHVLTSPAFLQE